MLLSVPGGQLSPTQLTDLARDPQGVGLRSGSRLAISRETQPTGAIVISPSDPRRDQLVAIAHELAKGLSPQQVLCLSPGLDCPVGPLIDVHLSEDYLSCGNRRFHQPTELLDFLVGETAPAGRAPRFSREQAIASIGWLPQPDGRISLGAGAPDGRISSHLLGMLAVIESPVSITPWGSLVIHDLSEGIADQVLRVLAPLGLIFDANSKYLKFDGA